MQLSRLIWFPLSCYVLKSHQRGDLTPAETKVDYLPFANVLPRFFTRKEMHSSVSVRWMEALYYHGVKRMEVCLLHFRREDSGNYLNGRIPEKWFCFNFTLSVLLPRKGKHSRERVNPPSRLGNPLELSLMRHTSVHEMFTTRPNVWQS